MLCSPFLQSIRPTDCSDAKALGRACTRCCECGAKNPNEPPGAMGSLVRGLSPVSAAHVGGDAQPSERPSEKTCRTQTYLVGQSPAKRYIR